MRKKLMSLLLVIALCASLLTIGAAAEEEYNVSVTPMVGYAVFVTSDNAANVLGDGTVSYDAESKTLTLNSASVKGVNFNEAGEDYILQISGSNTITGWIYASKSSLTLKGNGTLNVNSPETSAAVCADTGLSFESGSYVISSSASNAIYSPAYVEFTGTAHVKAISESDEYPAIYSNTSVSVSESAYVKANCQEDVSIYTLGKFEVSGEAVVYAEGSQGIQARGGIELSGGNVTAAGLTDAGIYANGCDMTIGGNAVVSCSADSTGFALVVGSSSSKANSLVIKDDAQVTVTSENGDGVFTGKDLTIQDNASLTTVSTYSYGDVSILGNAKVIANASGVASNGICSIGKLTISGSGVTVSASSDTDNYPAINAYNGIDITGGAKVDAQAEGSHAIFTSNNTELNVSGSGTKVSASSEFADGAAIFGTGSISITEGANVEAGGSSAGIFTNASENITIDGSVVTIDLKDDTKWSIYSGSKIEITDSWVDSGSNNGNITVSDSVLFTGSEGYVEGNATVPGDAVVPEDKTLTVESGTNLTVPNDVTLTNNGKVVIEGILDNEGSYADFGETEGTVTGDGELTNYWYVTLKYGNGASDEVRNIVRGKSTTLPTPTRSGYAFLGWACSDGKTYSGGETVAVTSDLAFTASWVRHPDTPYVPEPEQPEEPETPAFPFYDVPASAWYYTAVKYVYENKLMDGVDTYVFAPNDTLTRAMIWTIIARMSGVDTTGGATWYAKAQEWVVAKGISDGENPTAAITREEFVTMLWRLAGEPVYTGDLSRVPDAGSISAWAQHAMLWAYATGLVEGDETGAITPTANANRAAAAALIMRYLEA